MTSDGLTETEHPASSEHSVGAESRRLPFLALCGIALVLLLLVRAFVVQSFYVPTASMEPTIEPGDRLLVAVYSDPAGLRRGDVIVFDGTTVFDGPDRTPALSSSVVGRALSGAASFLSVDLGEKDYVKRVVGLPGDSVRCCTSDGRLSVNGRPVVEDQLAPGMRASTVPFDVVVPDGRLFVLGDNRPESSDSRDHLGDPGGGMVPEDDVIGTVLWRYWPLSRVGGLQDAAGLRAISQGRGP